MFSVVIPLYNKSAEIERCLRSVLAQTFNEFRVLVVDDGSTDDSAEKVKRFTDPRILLIQQQNGGVAAARNAGIAAAGEWVAFLDADDTWHKGHLQNLSEMRTRCPKAEFLFTGYSVKRGSMERSVRLRGVRGIAPVDYLALPDGKLVPSCTAFTRSALLAVGGYREMFGEDVDVWFRVGALYPTAYSSRVTAVWHLDAANRRCDEEAALVTRYEPGSLLQSLEVIARMTTHARVVSRAKDYLKRRERGAIVSTLRSGDKQHALYLRDWWHKAFDTQDAGLDRLLSLPLMLHRKVGEGLNALRRLASLAGYTVHRLRRVPSRG